ncbi:MAG: glucose-6-phosphate dehydrogenase assembly protein OpcA [Chloroflexota bacterium]|nr:glucose-6-phosphate dehydrogenase assembly protein OpcA [Dehalococcoidia bacterium]MDW8255299.1 glucose-6-phosphate dehydrogenase assembly protein OpcA [Chloroflexota bacterium]
MPDQNSCAASWAQPFASTLGVEEALAELTRQTTRTLGVGAAARARMLNLVAISSDPRSAATADRLLGTLGRVHPSRLARVRLDPAAADEVRAQIAVRCRLEEGSECPVVYETVEVEAGGNAARHLVELIAPVLEADLPVIIWWAGLPPFGESTFIELLAFADQFVVDSAALGEEGVGPLADLLATGPPITDLAWGRLRPWRDLVAALFDLPPLATAIGEIRALTVSDAGAPVEALLLVGWLAAALGWHAALPSSGGDRSRRSLVRPGGEVALTFVSENGPPGLRQLAVEAGDAHLVITAGDTNADARIARAGAPSIARHERLVIPDDGALLASALLRRGRDPDWEAALRVAALLARR